MRIALIFSFLFLLGLTHNERQHSSSVGPPNKASLTSPALKIYGARLKGKKLIVEGENFDDGAVILVNGELMKTTRDLESSSSRLVAKKAGNAIPVDTVYRVSVRNSSGEEEYIKNFRGSLFNARVLPVWGEGGLVDVDKGQYLVTTESFEDATLINIDSNYIERITDIPLPPSNYRLFRAKEYGVTWFRAELYYGGDLAPTIFYSVLIRIN